MSENQTSENQTIPKSKHMLVRLSDVRISDFGHSGLSFCSVRSVRSVRSVCDFLTKLDHYIYNIIFYDPKEPKRSSLANGMN